LSRNSTLRDECNRDSSEISLDNTKQLDISVIDSSTEHPSLMHGRNGLENKGTKKFKNGDDDIDSFAVSSTDGQRTDVSKSTIIEQFAEKIELKEKRKNSSVPYTNQGPYTNNDKRFEDVTDGSELLPFHNQKTSTPKIRQIRPQGRKRQDSDTQFPHIEDTIKKLGFTEYAINTWKRPIIIKRFFDRWYYKTFGFTSVYSKVTYLNNKSSSFANGNRNIQEMQMTNKLYSNRFSKIKNNKSKQSPGINRVGKSNAQVIIPKNQGYQRKVNYTSLRTKKSDALRSPEMGKGKLNNRLAKHINKTNIPTQQGKQSHGKINIFYEIDRDTKQRRINFETTDPTLRNIIKQEFERKKGLLTVPQLYQFLGQLDVEQSA
jgi:hypothetical protein